jgi:NAD(P)-dependent dehydrogenase (short-subunit alcohol dehydrogenase family)
LQKPGLAAASVNLRRRLGRGDLFVSNAGNELFGTAEAFSDEQIGRVVVANLVGSIQLIRSASPHRRVHDGGRLRRPHHAIYELPS